MMTISSTHHVMLTSTRCISGKRVIKITVIVEKTQTVLLEEKELNKMEVEPPIRDITKATDLTTHQIPLIPDTITATIRSKIWGISLETLKKSLRRMARPS